MSNNGCCQFCDKPAVATVLRKPAVNAVGIRMDYKSLHVCSQCFSDCRIFRKMYEVLVPIER